MATDRSTVTFIIEQLFKDGDVSAKPMFGEHGLYRDGKMFGMICEGQLFIKPTAGGRAFTGSIEEAPPYPGAKPCLLVDADRWLARRRCSRPPSAAGGPCCRDG